MAGNSQVFIFHGSEEGLVSEHSRQCFAGLTSGTSEFSHEIIEGNASDSEHAAELCLLTVQALQTMPMFGGRKVVWLKNANFLGDSVTGRSETTQQALQMLGAVLQGGLGDDVCLIVSASEFDKRRAFNKLLLTTGDSKEFSKPDISRDGWEAEVAALARQAASEQGLEFDHDALDLFVHRVSESSRQIASEIAKLGTYIGNERKVISEEDIRQITPVTHSGVIFEISRSIENGQPHETLRLIDIQLENGEQPVSLIRAAIIPTLRNLLTAKVLSSKFNLNTFSYKEFCAQLSSLPFPAGQLVPAKKDGSPNAYPLFLATQKVRKFDLKKLKKALKQCFEADKLLVSSSIDSRLVLHRLAISLSF